MNLEQRLAAVEEELAAMKAKNNTVEELSATMSKIVREAIKNERRPGGTLHRSGRSGTADMKSNVRYDAAMSISI